MSGFPKSILRQFDLEFQPNFQSCFGILDFFLRQKKVYGGLF